MTVAACYFHRKESCSERTARARCSCSRRIRLSPGAEHYYNSAQKVFQVGQDSTLGITMWGLGGLTTTSYRTLIARFADLLVTQGAKSMADVAALLDPVLLVRIFDGFRASLQRIQQLLGQDKRTPEEEGEVIGCGGSCRADFVSAAT